MRFTRNAPSGASCSVTKARNEASDIVGWNRARSARSTSRAAAAVLGEDLRVVEGELGQLAGRVEGARDRGVVAGAQLAGGLADVDDADGVAARVAVGI